MVFVVGILVLSGILHSWSMYPLNNKPIAFDAVASDLPKFKQTDRFYFVYQNFPRKMGENLKRIKYRIEDVGGPVLYSDVLNHADLGSYQWAPALNLHGHISFIQNDVGEYINHIFNGDGVQRLNNIRDLVAGPLVASELLDMGAVNYYYSTLELQDVPDNLMLYKKVKYKTLAPLYIYKNLSAWPYYYLANSTTLKEQDRHLKNVQPGIAYLTKDNYFTLSENAGSSLIHLKEFSYGRMTFEFDGDKEELLVVADAWHPFWKAKMGDKHLPVFKANDIFKGVKIPAGKGTITLYFDTSPYMPGVYVSVVAWVIFTISLFLSIRYKWGINIFQSMARKK